MTKEQLRQLASHVRTALILFPDPPHDPKIHGRVAPVEPWKPWLKAKVDSDLSLPIFKEIEEQHTQCLDMLLAYYSQ